MTLEVKYKVEDVLKVCPSLTKEQAFEVLKAIENENNPAILINWDTIKGMAQWLYGE